MPNLSGSTLESFGKNIFLDMGLCCFNPLNQVQLNKIKPESPFHKGEHFEFDYLIPVGDTCVFGEITARTSPRDVKAKYEKFRRNMDFLTGIDFSNPEFWNLIGIDEPNIGRFLGVTKIKGLFISTELLFFDAPLQIVPNIVCYFKPDWNQLINYSESIGKYACNLFNDSLRLESSPIRRPLEIREVDHKLIRSVNVKVSGGSIGSSDVFTFEASPYELIPYARVFRYDLLPCLESSIDYQRPLILEKLEKIRSNLLVNPSFMFPNSILLVLSPESSYIENQYLRIPDYYGSIAVVDGQHRLFSYANENIRDHMGEQCKILVTAIKFITQNKTEIQKFSAKMFIEINSTQTPVKPTHIDAIAFPILDETYSRTLAAQIILTVNKKENSRVFGIFDTNQTNYGKIKSTTVITALQTITNLSLIKKLSSSRRGKKIIHKQGYENIFESSISELENPNILIERGSITVDRYFGIVASTFNHEWIKREIETNSAFEYTKFISALIRLLNMFIIEGLNWEEITLEIRKIKNNVMQLRELNNYSENKIIFDMRDPRIPNASFSLSRDFRFLNANRVTPTSILNV